MTRPDAPVDRILPQLHKLKQAPGRREWTARCPAHEDRTPSLSIAEGADGRVLLTCHAGCTVDAILAALGLSARDLFTDTPPRDTARHKVAEYVYTDAQGAPLYYRDRVEWLEGGKRCKALFPRQLDGTKRGAPPVPYNLPAVAHAIATGEPVLLVEGEKPADALDRHGYAATTTGAATSWRKHYAEHFRGAHVVLWPDADAPGESYAAAAAADLLTVAASVRVLRFPGKGDGWDAADFWQEGGTTDALDRLLADAPAWAPLGEDVQICAPAEGEPEPEPESPWMLMRTAIGRPELLAPPEAEIERVAYRARSVLLVGPPKGGKSTLAGKAAAAKTRGDWFLGAKLTPGNVVICAPDESLGDTVRRLHEMRADPDRVQLLSFAPPNLLASLRELLTRWPASVVIVDSLAEYARLVRGSAPEDGDSSGWGDVVRPLVQLVCREMGCALLLLHHPRRSDGAYRGSSEIFAAVDGMLEMTLPDRGEDQTVRKLRGRARFDIPPFSVALRGDHYELVGGAELSVDVRVLMFVERHAAGGTSTRAIRDGVSGARAGIDAAITALLARGAIERRGDGRLYPALAVQGGLEAA
jgi:hypothetical protein